MKTIVIESHENGVEWGISFNGSNPEPKDYFKMPDKETAFRLCELLNQGNSNLLGRFFNHKSDANKYLSATEQEDLMNEFSAYCGAEEIWPEHARLKMIEKKNSFHYGKEYEYGFYDGYCYQRNNC